MGPGQIIFRFLLAGPNSLMEQTFIFKENIADSFETTD